MSFEQNQHFIQDSIVLVSESSLLGILNQQSTQTQTSTSQQQTKIYENIDDKLSTLFNTTGRERNATGPLKQWLYEHQDNPYPKEKDRLELMKQTQMTAAQITIWFTNARVRLRKENKEVKLNKRKLDEDNDDIIFLPTPSPSIRPFTVAYSNLYKDQIINLYNLASFYPNQIEICENVNERTTHLIIGKEEQPLLCPLTKKLFESIARHLFIISARWIDDCLNQNQLLNEDIYEIRGDLPYGEYHDGMKRSRLSKHMKLFEKCQFFILCDHCQDYMSKNELILLIKLCHGSVLDNFPITSNSHDSILTIVLCNEILAFDNIVEQQLFEIARSNGVHFVNPEWLLESIVHFQLQPFNLYQENL